MPTNVIRVKKTTSAKNSYHMHCAYSKGSGYPEAEGWGYFYGSEYIYVMHSWHGTHRPLISLCAGTYCVRLGE